MGSSSSSTAESAAALQRPREIGDNSIMVPSEQSRDPIGALMPWTSESERQVRNRLLKAQQFSARRARQTHSDIARSLLWLLNEIAAAHATAPAPVEALTDVADTLARLGTVVNGIERMEVRDAS